MDESFYEATSDEDTNCMTSRLTDLNLKGKIFDPDLDLASDGVCKINGYHGIIVVFSPQGTE